MSELRGQAQGRMTVGMCIAFLRSCIRSGERLSADDEAMIDAVLEAARVAEDAAADLRDQNILWNEWMAEIQEKLRVAEAKAALLPDGKCIQVGTHPAHVGRRVLRSGSGYFYCPGIAERPLFLTPAAPAAEGGKG